MNHPHHYADCYSNFNTLCLDTTESLSVMTMSINANIFMCLFSFMLHSIDKTTFSFSLVPAFCTLSSFWGSSVCEGQPGGLRGLVLGYQLLSREFSSVLSHCSSAGAREQNCVVPSKILTTSAFLYFIDELQTNQSYMTRLSLCSLSSTIKSWQSKNMPMFSFAPFTCKHPQNLFQWLLFQGMGNH